MRSLAAVVVALLVLAASPVRAEDARVVVLVRHGEKAKAPADDPALSDAGHARAEALAAVLAGARVDAVITTQYTRTRATAEPVAKARGLTPVVIRGGGDTAAHAGDVAAAVRAQPAGSLVLVVGHSNTVPAIIAALGGPALDDLCDGEYATLFTLIVPESGAPRLVRSTYGVPDPPAAGCGKMLMK